MKSWPIALLGCITVALFLSYGGFLLWENWPPEDWPIEKAAQFGDSFGVLNSLFTAGAFLLILWTIVLQQAELRLQRQEMSRIVDLHRREASLDLISQSYDDEDLAEVWGDDFVSMKEFKQHSYIHLILFDWRTSFKQGMHSKEATRKILYHHMRKSRCFRNYWAKNSAVWKSYDGDSSYREFCQLADLALSSARAELGQA